MLFDAKTESFVSVEETQAPATLSFDWETRSYRMDNGTPVSLTGRESAKAWLEQCIRTPRGRYGIYPANYGCSAMDLIGHKNQNGTALPDLEQELKQAIVYCDEIQDIGNVRYADGKILADCVFQGEAEVVEIARN